MSIKVTSLVVRILNRIAVLLAITVGYTIVTFLLPTRCNSSPLKKREQAKRSKNRYECPKPQFIGLMVQNITGYPRNGEQNRSYLPVSQLYLLAHFLPLLGTRAAPTDFQAQGVAK